MPESTATTPARDVAGEIRSWLPAHTHEARPGGPFDGATVWTWTTSAGTWVVTLTRPFLSSQTLSLRCPDGGLKLGPADRDSLRRLHGVLVALDAIPTDTEPETDRG